MCPERIIRRFAGVFLLVSIALAILVSPWWLAFTAFVGVNLLQSSFSAFCPLEKILGRFRLCGCSTTGVGATGS
ncbi:MAG: DUF2892 domain-containing protein [Gemmatimonadota bacterium]|jgi:hypothetical protein